MPQLEEEFLQKISNVSIGPDGKILHHSSIVAPEWARATVGLRKHVDIWIDPKEKKVLVVQFPDSPSKS